MENNDKNEVLPKIKEPQVKFRLSKAFIAYVVISLIIIVLAIVLIIK